MSRTTKTSFIIEDYTDDGPPVFVVQWDDVPLAPGDIYTAVCNSFPGRSLRMIEITETRTVIRKAGD